MGRMANLMDHAGELRLNQYFDRIGVILGDRRRRESFAVYAMGLLGDGERKSIEPIASRAFPGEADAAHQRLLHFATDSPWSDREVRREAACYAMEVMTEREPIEAWIVDDTGFIKQGSHSVGVQRQYTGSAGKITNCQLGVSLSITTRSEHLPIDFELYLPRSWMDNPERRAEARIPEDLSFKTKPELGLDMIRRARAGRVSKGVVLADTSYGNSDFRNGVRALNSTVRRANPRWRREGSGRDARSGQVAYAIDLASHFRAARSARWG